MFPNGILCQRLFRTASFRRYLSAVKNCRNPSSNYYAENLTSRNIIKVSGEESITFLQGLITNDIRRLRSEGDAIFTMFLNSKGRVMHEAIIYKSHSEDELWIESDISGLDDLEKHLKRFCLRRKVSVSKANGEFHIWVVFNPSLSDASSSDRKFAGSHDKNSNKICEEKNTHRDNLNHNDIFSALSKKFGSSVLVSEDPRLKYLGVRIVLPKSANLNEITTDCISVRFGHSPLYKEHRYKLGVGEGLEEIPTNECFPLEINCDYLDGVSFSKGCYIGQELTARTHHTGVVRKRLMPIMLESEPESKLSHNTIIENPEGKANLPIGKLKGIIGRKGIGLMRVREALGAETLKMGGIPVSTYRPHWWP